MEHVISELHYQGTILQRNNRKMAIKWSFSYNSFVKYHGKIFGSHNLTKIYPNLRYSQVCYKGTALYNSYILCSINLAIALYG